MHEGKAACLCPSVNPWGSSQFPLMTLSVNLEHGATASGVVAATNLATLSPERTIMCAQYLHLLAHVDLPFSCQMAEDLYLVHHRSVPFPMQNSTCRQLYWHLVHGHSNPPGPTLPYPLSPSIPHQCILPVLSTVTCMHVLHFHSIQAHQDVHACHHHIPCTKVCMHFLVLLG